MRSPPLSSFVAAVSNGRYRPAEEARVPNVLMDEMAIPSEDEAKEAAAAAKQLSPLVSRRAKRHPRRIRIRPADGEEEVVVPESAFRLFVDLLELMAKGSAVTVVPVNAELTTQQAADMLNVSRPYLVGLLEQNAIPFRRVGNRRRVLMRDLVAFKARDDQHRREVAERLTAEAQELGLEY